MPIVLADWSVAANGDIRYVGDDHGGASPSYATVIEFHRWLKDLADDASYTGDDIMDITKPTPSERSTDNFITLINSYNIDDNASEHLYDGSIVQGGASTTIYDGIVNFGNAAVQIQMIQNGAVLSDDWWNFNNAGLNADATQGISHRFLMKVRVAGTDTDGRRLIGTCRRFNQTYSEFSINGTSRGNNVLALKDASDLNNQTAAATVATWTDVTNTNEGYNGIDVNNDGTNEFYYSKWDRASRTINQFYERLKWVTRDGSAETTYGISGELFRGITHELPVGAPRTGTFSAFENVTWTGGSGRMVAIDSTTTSTKLWLQVLTGTAPGSGVLITGTTSTATTTTSGTATSRTISTPFVGVSTGSAIIGSYGLGLEAADLSASDKVFDLTNTQITPPDNRTTSVAGLVSTEDYVLVGPEDGAGGLDTDQLTLATSLSGAGETAVVVTAAIPSDTPASGSIRIQLNSGKYRKVTYTSWATSTFTIPSTDFTADNATQPKNVYVSYLDKLAAATTESFNYVHVGARTLFLRVRDGGGTPIKDFETTFAIGSTATAIRTSDA